MINWPIKGKIILSIIVLMCIVSIYGQTGFFDLKNKHIGIEYNLFWNFGDCSLVADYENFAHGDLHRVKGIFLDTDFSIQYTVFKDFILRYTYTKICKDIDGPVGPDRYYKYGDRNSLDYDLEEVEFEYDQSGSENISHIVSVGYPIILGNIDLSSIYLSSQTPFTIILFAGIAFANNSIMDEYVRTERFSDWYFLNEYNWYIENRIRTKSVKFSFGITLPFIIQTSLFYTGSDWRLMFGFGI